MNTNETTEILAMREAAYGFVKAITKIAKLDKEKATAKIALYRRWGLMDVIEYKHNAEIIDDYDFIEKKDGGATGEFVAKLKGDTAVTNVRFIDHDYEKDIFVFLLKPETAEVVKDKS